MRDPYGPALKTATMTLGVASSDTHRHGRPLARWFIKGTRVGGPRASEPFTIANGLRTVNNQTANDDDDDLDDHTGNTRSKLCGGLFRILFLSLDRAQSFTFCRSRGGAIAAQLTAHNPRLTRSGATPTTRDGPQAVGQACASPSRPADCRGFQTL
jgi:hypothetical protein